MERALDMQVGGDHYKKLKIQPVEYIVANNIGYLEGNVIKYITRWRDKGGVHDLEKAKHYIDMLMELQNQKAKAGMLELVQEELDKTKAEDTPMLAETKGLDREELLEHGQTKLEAIKNLLKTYKRVIVRYNEKQRWYEETLLTWLDRVKLELEDLDKKRTKLAQTLEKGRPEYISEDEWERLHKQEEAMGAYAFILQERITAAVNKQSEETASQE